MRGRHYYFIELNISRASNSLDRRCSWTALNSRVEEFGAPTLGKCSLGHLVLWFGESLLQVVLVALKCRNIKNCKRLFEFVCFLLTFTGSWIFPPPLCEGLLASMSRKKALNCCKPQIFETWIHMQVLSPKYLFHSIAKRVISIRKGMSKFDLENWIPWIPWSSRGINTYYHTIGGSQA